jgi:small GTP-binding protein
VSAKNDKTSVDSLFDTLGQRLLQNALETGRTLIIPQKNDSGVSKVSKNTIPDDTIPTVFKYVIVGNTQVGKSCLMQKICNNTFTQSHISTIGIDFAVRALEINGITRKLQIWDTAGGERFHTITTAYYRGATALIMVYDCTDRDSFYSVMQKWWTDVNKFKAEDALIVVIGNKKDDETKREVSYEEGLSFANSVGCLFFETSAKNDTDDLINAMVTITKKVILKIQESAPTPLPELIITQKKEPEPLEALVYVFFMEIMVLATIVSKLISK